MKPPSLDVLEIRLWVRETEPIVVRARVVRATKLIEGFNDIGAQFLPGGDGEHLSADGTMRFASERTQLTGTLRFFNERAGTPMSPNIASALTGIDSLGLQQPQSAMQYTAGFRALDTGLPSRCCWSARRGSSSPALWGCASSARSIQQ